jgi:hypothetical protein
MTKLEYIMCNISIFIDETEKRINSREWVQKYSDNTKGANGVAILSSIGALAYLISITIGGGSYQDIMPAPVAIFLSYALVAFLLVVLGFFLFTSLTVMESFFNLKTAPFGPPRKKQSYLNFWTKFISSVIIFIIFTSTTWYFSIGITQNAVNIVIMLILVLIITAFLLLAIMDVISHAAHGTIIELFVAISIFVLTSLICLNGFRDSQKAALVADSQYCFWLQSALSKLILTNASTEEIEQAKLENDKACTRLIEKGINLEAIAVSN